MIVLGLDPGLHRTGFGFVSVEGGLLSVVSTGVIKPRASCLPGRLQDLFVSTVKLIDQFSPAEVAVEDVFVKLNPRTSLLLGQARGALICAAVSLHKKVFEYTALQIKKSVVGNGRADKSQVCYMVRELLSLSSFPAVDASDALACAICHIYRKVFDGNDRFSYHDGIGILAK